VQRSAGVTASAIVALLGSLMALATGMFMVLALVAAPTPPMDPNFPASPEFFRVIRVVVPLFYLLPAAWGITTSIGLFRLRNWARISIIVFAGLLAVFGLFGLLGAFAMFAMPAPAMPPGARLDPNLFLMMMRVFMVAFALAQLGISSWWLVFFNRAKVREQFIPPLTAFVPYPASAGTPPPPSLHTTPTSQPAQSPPVPTASWMSMPGRPVSITIIGWYLLLGALLLPVNLLLHTPAVLLLKILTGWQAIAYFLAMLVLNVYVGIGVLRLQPAARWTGIGYFVFAFLNSAVFFFAPGGLERMRKLLEIQQSWFPWLRQMQGSNPFPFDTTPFMIIGAVTGMAIVLIPLCFLIINHRAFARSAATA
jgi:hypothetical protein